MTEMRHIDPDDLALHAMQLLSGEDASAIQTHLKECSVCREEFRRMQGDLGVLALGVEQTAPDQGARERFLRRVANEPRKAPARDSAEHRQGNVIPIISAKKPSASLLPWLGWAVAAGAILSTASLYHERTQMQATIAAQSGQMKTETAEMAAMSAEQTKAQMVMDALTDTNAMRVTLNATPAQKALPQGRATYLPNKGALVFIANNLEPLPIAKVYELWVIPANGDAPMPAGTFRPDAHGNASVVMPPMPKDIQAKAFGVTMEAEGGSSKPTLPILMVGS